MNLEFNQELIYPEHARTPDWVVDRLTRFHTKMKQDTDSIKNEQLLQDAIIDNIEQNILHPDLSITGTLDSNGISILLNKLDEVTSDLMFMWYYYLLMQCGFTLSTVIPSSFQPEALELPKEFVNQKDTLVKKYNDSDKTTEDALEFQKNVTKIAAEVKKYFEDNNIRVVDLLNSGAKGNVSHIQSLLLSVGLSINSFGEINDVIGNSHSEGMTQTQFFNGSSQAIQALYAKSAETSIPGYLGRKLGTITERIKLSSIPDCGTNIYFELKVRDAKMLKSLAGKYYRTMLGIEMQLDDNSDVVGDTIKLRSPLYCKAKDGICKRCYNARYIERMNLNPGDNIGLLASTGLTGSLVNLTLKKSHSGISLDKENIDFREEVKHL